VCHPRLTRLLTQYPYYANLGVIAPDGQVLCSAVSLSVPLNLADRVYVPEALARRTFAMGEYQIGRITGKASINVGYPMLDPTEAVQAIIFAALDLAWLTQLAAAAHLPSGTALTVLDRQGTVVVRYPDPERWVGQSLPEDALVRGIMTHPGEGTAEVAGLDAIPRLYAFTPCGGVRPAMG
jgi:hypothetical protein